jgi:hypothetical protein
MAGIAKVRTMLLELILADEWSGLFGPFILLLMAVVLFTGLVIGVGVGIGGIAILKVFVPRGARPPHDPQGVRRSTLRNLIWIGMWGCGGLVVGFVLAVVFRGPSGGPMMTANLTEREAFAGCFFIPLGVGTGVAAGISLLWRFSR